MTNEDSEHTVFFKAGWWTIATGVIFFALFIVDYNNEFLFKYGGLDKLAAIIASTTGILLSLAGLFFVLDNLQLQRETLKIQKDELSHQIDEMRQSNEHSARQNESLLNQQYQTTFFNILNSYSDGIAIMKFGDEMGYNGLNLYHLKITNSILNYTHSISSRIFTNSNETHQNPIYKFEADKSSWDAYFENIITLLKFIDEKLRDKLYYNLLYNKLSIEEKFLIGLYCDCFNNEFVAYFNRPDLRFKEYYLNQDIRYRFSKFKYFPMVDIYRFGNITQIIEEDLPDVDDTFKFHIEVRQFLLNEAVLLESIDIKIYEGRPFGKEIFSKSQDCNCNFNSKNSFISEVNLTEAINEQMINFPVGQNEIKLEFKFRYVKKLFVIKFKITIITQDYNAKFELRKQFHISNNN